MAAGEEGPKGAPGPGPVGKVGRTPRDASVEALAAAAAHDLNNALTGIFGGLDFAADSLRRGRIERLPDDLQQIQEAAERLAQLSRALDARARGEDYVPPAPPAPVAEPASSGPLPVPGRVLVIEDEPTIVEVVVQALGPAHTVVACTSSLAALRLLQDGEPFDVILCDLTMAELDGPAVYDAIQALSPALARRVVFMSGGAFTPRARAFLERYAGPVLAKPFAIPALRDLVAEAVARARSDGSSGIG